HDTSAARRFALATLASSIEQRIMTCRGSGAEHALMTWITTSNALPTADWLGAFPAINNQRLAFTHNRTVGENRRVVALLLLQPDKRKRPSESLT
ncbi:MAG: hypothetical protein ABI852_18990, partial [Gemmatimonadaceae bacterium]